MAEGPNVGVAVASSTAGPYTGTGIIDDAQPMAVRADDDDLLVLGAEPRSAAGRLISRCEELFGGSITCPTCDGTGKVSRDREHDLVALIPMNDRRLRPRHTKLYVAVSVVMCFLVAGLLLFFLFPRSINLRSNQPTLIPLEAGYGENHTTMYMTVVNMYNVTNENFYQVELTSVVASMLLNQRILASTTNSSSLTISMRSTKLYYITLNATFSLELDYIIQYCWYFPAASFFVQCQATATFSYFQKSEEMTLITYQYINCPKHH